MTTQEQKALELALEALENLEEQLPFDWAFDELKTLAGKDDYKKALKKVRGLIPKIKNVLAQKSNEPALDALKWIASHDLSGVDERALALMSYAFVHKARFAVLEATGETT